MSIVLFLSVKTMGDALAGIGRSFRPYFEELGYEFAEVDFADSGDVEFFNRSMNESEIEFAFSFMGTAADLSATTSDGSMVNVWTARHIPFISLYGDTPAYFFDRHVVPSPLSASIYAFSEHFDLRRTLPKVNGLLGVGPPFPMDVTDISNIDFATKVRGRLLFLKNGNDPDALFSEWQTGLSPSIFQMLAALSSELLSRMSTDTGNRIDMMVSAYFSDLGLDISQATNLRLFCVAQLDDYLRRCKSTLMAKTLMKFPVDMYGHNWGHLDFSGQRLNFSNGGDYASSTSLIRESLGVLDMSPNTTSRPHERALRAFGSYTLCLTNQQEFYSETFPTSDDFTFSFDAESLSAKVADVIANPKRYVDIGVEAAHSFREKYPRLGSAEFLVRTAATLRLAFGQRPSPLQPFFIWPANPL